MTTKMAQKSKEKSGNRKINVRSIRKRAQEIYLKRTERGAAGDADSDWRQAEDELMNQ